MVGKIVFGLAGIRPVITDKTGLPGGPMEGKKRLDTMGPVLVVCNHTSTVDMWIGMWLNPVGACGVAKREILRIPFFGLIYWLTGHLLLDRSNLQKSIKSMAEIGRFVRQNKLGVWMWPEGSRSREGALKPFKKGFVHMAIATGLPVLPIVSHDADRMWPGGSFKIRPGDLQMEVLPPIDTSEWTKEQASEHVSEVRSIIRAALRDRQRGEA
jgi:1-acyl-sn-glycerol-3-phosphate acyltransferase